jgi:hemolysin III
LRGKIHAGVVPLVAATGTILIVLAPSTQARIAAALYVLCALTLFTASATHHLNRWSGRARRVAHRLDHAGIFLIIAGTYTPYVVLGLDGATRVVVLGVVWGAALAGVGLRLASVPTPRWVSIGLYVALGWTAAFVFPQLLSGVGVPSTVLALVGGGLYSVGAIVYATKRPNPLPRTVGFHEVFHLLTVAAFASLDVGVWLVLY